MRTIRDHAANRPAATADLKDLFFLDADEPDASKALYMCVEKDAGAGLYYEWDLVRRYKPGNPVWEARLAPIDDRT